MVSAGLLGIETALVWLQTSFYFKLSPSQVGAFNLIFIAGFYLGLNLVTFFFHLKKRKKRNSVSHFKPQNTF